MRGRLAKFIRLRRKQRTTRHTAKGYRLAVLEKCRVLRAELKEGKK